MEVAMITDGRVKELRRMLVQGKPLAASARMTLMDEKTARSYRDDDRLPSQRKRPRDYRTRTDPFADVWSEVQQRLEAEPKLKAQTLFAWLQQTQPGEFPDSTRRTFERRVANWRSLHGPGKTVFFPQQHHAGRLAASDFTVMNSLNVKIAGARFDHTLFHCVLTYSNVESVSLCFSESFEALSEGLQKAFWEFGGVPQRHRTDSLSAAIKNHSSRKTHTDRYTALMAHYGCEPERTNARCANENGDVESANGHVKDRIEQGLLLRGSRDFVSRDDYLAFVEQIIAQANANRRERFGEEQVSLDKLPDDRLDTDDVLRGLRVSSSSTIQVRTNTYSVPSRLIDAQVDVRIGAEQIVVMHQGHHVQTMPRLVGKHGQSINYRHVIDSLVRKPGAFRNYRYREEMFPTSQFRIAYDLLQAAHTEKVADKQYVQLLELAAHESQDAVADALRVMIATDASIDVESIRSLVLAGTNLPAATGLEVEPPNLTDYDSLLQHPDMESLCNDPSDNAPNSNHMPANTSPHADGKTESGRDAADDGPVSRASSAELSRALSAGGDSCRDGESQSLGLSLGVNDTGMRNSAGGSDPAIDDPLATSAGQDLGVIRLRAASVEREAAVGNASRRLVPESSGKCSAVRQAGIGQEPRAVCVVPAVGAARSQHAVYDLRPVGSTTAARQTGLASAEADQTVLELRGFDHRRPGLRATESRGDGGVVHVAGRALRARQRVTDEQLSVQQMGPDLQGRDDDRRRDRSSRSPQCDHRVERAQLPCRDSQASGIPSTEAYQLKILTGNSNCR
jgi:hypothetical protein